MADTTMSEEEILARLGDVPEVTYVKEHRVSCNGGDGALGHPVTWYTINDDGYAECGYCDRAFIFNPEKAS